MSKNNSGHQTEFEAVEIGEFHTIILGGKVKKRNENKAMANLVDLLTDPKKKDLKIELLRELKTENAKDFLVNTIIHYKTFEHLNLIVAACWEVGLDFSSSLSLFIDLAISNEFLICMEALTVIENMEGPFNQKELDESKNKLEIAIVKETSEKQELLREILNALDK